MNSSARHDRKRIVVLGSTGSVGEKALAVARRFDDRLAVVGLFAHGRVDRLAEQVAQLRPAWVAVGELEAAARFDRSCLPPGTRFLAGPDSLVGMAGISEVDLVVNAVVGSAGLAPSLEALESGKNLALANKESVVLGGELLRAAARRTGARILPVDSEHSGLMQCLEGQDSRAVKRIILTASGGPFRRHTAGALARVTPEEALVHPIWPMGRRITVDSATLLNKGLEVLEAHWLFDVPVDQVEVLIHPQSLVHALVEMQDGSVIAQMAAPDMTLPVQYALSWPERWNAPLPPLDLTTVGPLEFSAPDRHLFPCLDLAYEAARRGGLLPAVMNAADEVAVEAFLSRRIRFVEIADVIRQVMASSPGGSADSLAAILEADTSARRRASELIPGGGAV